MSHSPISIEQIKAARALIRWSQKSLAASTSLSIATIRKIESGHAPRKATIENIRKAIEREGVEFTAGDGVRRRENKALFFAGKNAVHNLFTEMFGSSVRQKTIITAFLNDTLAFSSLLEEILAVASGHNLPIEDIILFKCLVPPSEKIRRASFLAANIASDSSNLLGSYCLINNKLALMYKTTEGLKCIMLQDNSISKLYLCHYNHAWENSTPVLYCK